MMLRSGSAATVLSIALCSWHSDAAHAPMSHDPHRAELFTSSEQCGVCHTTAPGAKAMLSKEGEDISPYGTWQATMMANAFRDPYFRAQIMKETASAGEHVQELCLRCHTPMMHHQARIDGKPDPRLADVVGDPFADDGVSCTVCHLMDGSNFGDAASFSGRPAFTKERKIFGPYEKVATRPMQNMVGYTPTHGPHVQKSALCATCHTLFTEHHGTPFPEQTPYLEWRNSEFSNEREGADPAKTRTCQQCHMVRSGPTRIARSPQGFDFRIPEREDYGMHAFIGGNAFMLDMLAEHREELDVLAEPEQFQRLAAATRKQLAEDTARMTISPLARDGGALTFAIAIENLTGHKFPSGYPARRAWLQVEIACGDRVFFASGVAGADGRIQGVADEQRVPHATTVTRPEQVAIYEMVAADPDGAPTTYLTKMVKRVKDTRLLPRGWRADGPHVADTAPVGVDGDVDFTGGGDTVQFRIDVPADATGPCEVRATLRYQTVPPVWVDALRTVDADEARRFVGWYDAAKKVPETVATATRREP